MRNFHNSYTSLIAMHILDATSAVLQVKDFRVTERSVATFLTYMFIV